MKNQDMLQEGFFKKKSYADKLADKYMQYEPVTSKGNPNQGFTAAIDSKDVGELKKRLVGTLGAAVGGNNVKAMANKSIKTFPIIISDNVDPNTAVMIKNYLEIQYAEYLNQIISNQIIDITEFDKDSDANIAIQALNKITGDGVKRKSDLANKALRGKLNMDDLGSNSALYSLLKQESVEYKSGDESVDAILKEAIIVDSSNADVILNLLMEDDENKRDKDPNENNNDEDKKSEETKDGKKPEGTKTAGGKKTDPEKKDPEEDKLHTKSIITVKDLVKFAAGSNPTYISPRNVNGNQSTKSLAADDLYNITKINNKEIHTDLMRRGYVRTDADGFEHYDKLTNTSVVVDPQGLDTALNKTVGDMLLDKNNKYLKDRFEKATFLLQSNMISGEEYAAYVVQRLGLPMRNEVRRELISNFKTKNLVKSSFDPEEVGFYTEREVKEIQRNAKRVNSIVKKITSSTVRDVMKVTAAAGVGAGVGALSISAIAGLGLISGGLIPAGAAAGAIISAVLAKISSNKQEKQFEAKVSRYQSWERVEYLINRMDENDFRIRVNAKKYELTRKSDASVERKAKEELRQSHLFSSEAEFFNSRINKDITKDKEGNEHVTPNLDSIPMDKIVAKYKHDLEKSYVTESTNHFYEELSSEELGCLSEEAMLYNAELNNALYEELNLEEREKELLQEKVKISTLRPSEITVNKISYNDKLQSVVPSFGTKNVVAYGSVEFDRRELKDRRFNTPLVMTVRFKERYSDGKFADNELTAVIGILGVVTRVPSEEMEYILKANAQGTTIKGIFPGETGNHTLDDLLSKVKIKTTDYSKLPQSGEVWNDLEKVRELAMANKLAGRATNNIANAHIIFSQKEMDTVRQTDGVDYLRDKKLTAGLMRRYSAMTLMSANDTLERVFVFDDIDANSWNVVPYSALRGKDSSEQLAAQLSNLMR